MAAARESTHRTPKNQILIAAETTPANAAHTRHTNTQAPNDGGGCFEPKAKSGRRSKSSAPVTPDTSAPAHPFTPLKTSEPAVIFLKLPTRVSASGSRGFINGLRPDRLSRERRAFRFNPWRLQNSKTGLMIIPVPVWIVTGFGRSASGFPKTNGGYGVCFSLLWFRKEQTHFVIKRRNSALYARNSLWTRYFYF